jgi:hypothetical protein
VVSAGDVMENPKSGQQLVIRKMARDMAGDLLEIESVYTKPSPHRPPTFTSFITNTWTSSLAGPGVLLKGEERTLGEGELLIVPPPISRTGRAVSRRFRKRY